MSENLYEELTGEVYDAFHDAQSQLDFTFWRSLAMESWITKGASVLELAVGTGRIVLPLARLATEHIVAPGVVGIDRSPSMLEQARAKSGREPEEVRRQLVLLAGDMRDISAVLAETDRQLPGRFGLIFIAFSSLLHLTTYEDQVAMFRSIHDLLAPGSLFVFDVFNPDPLKLVDRMGPELVTERYDSATKRRAVRYEQNKRIDRSRQLISATHHIVVEKAGRRLVEKFLDLEIGYLWARDIATLCRDAGLIITGWWGDYDRSDFWASRNPPRQIVTCQRRV